MSKERLEFLKEAVDNAKFIESLPKNWIINIEWLIEQAEKVEEYKEIIEMTGENYELEQETNKRYREAIEFGIEYLKNSDIRQVQLVVTALKSALEGEE